jgi:hypothetical protein
MIGSQYIIYCIISNMCLAPWLRIFNAYNDKELLNDQITLHKLDNPTKNTNLRVPKMEVKNKIFSSWLGFFSGWSIVCAY